MSMAAVAQHTTLYVAGAGMGGVVQHRGGHNTLPAASQPRHHMRHT
jgi:hypothetical protein